MSENLDVTLHVTSSRCCLKFSIRSRRTPRHFWSLLKHQALVINKHVQFPLSLFVIEMVGGRNRIAFTKLYMPVPKIFYQDGHVFVETLLYLL